MNISRRHFIGTNVALGAGAAIRSVLAQRQAVSSPSVWTQAGSLRVIALRDSTIALPRNELIGASGAQAADALNKSVLAHVVRFRNQNVLVGTGAGGRAGASASALISQLAAHGLAPTILASYCSRIYTQSTSVEWSLRRDGPCFRVRQW